MFKTETHMHTMEVSPCGRKRAVEMVRAYKEAGYSTVFVSDHFQESTLQQYGDLPWEELVTLFFSGYYRAKCEGDKIGLHVLPAAEIAFPGSPHHYLAYGITREFLLRHPYIYTYGIEKFSRIAREAGILLAQAHPRRDGNHVPTPEYVEAMEVYNSNPRHNDKSHEVMAAAEAAGLPMIAGSDAHRDEDIAGAGVWSETEIKTVEDFITLVRSGKAQLIGWQK